MDWREGVDPDRRAQHYATWREFEAEVNRRRDWEEEQMRLLGLWVEKQDVMATKVNYIWGAILFLSGAIPIGLTVLGFLIK